jgi:hypothetical protein
LPDDLAGAAMTKLPDNTHKLAMAKQHLARRVEVVIVALSHLLRLLTGAEIGHFQGPDF